MDRKPTDDEVIDLAYANSRMPLDEIRANLGTVHPSRAMVVQPPDEGSRSRFTTAPLDLMAELDTVWAEAGSGEVGGFPGVLLEEFPFRLVSRRLKAILNSLGSELSALQRSAGTTNYAYIHPEDMGLLGLADDDLVEITSPRSTIVGVAQAAPDVRRGVVSMAHSWGSGLTDEKVRDIGTTTSRLVSTSEGHDPVNGMVVQSAIPVRLARALERAG